MAMTRTRSQRIRMLLALGLLLTGYVLVLAGTAMLAVPVALIIGGLGLLAFGLLAIDVRPKR
jgi:hypothetical protein